jgi:hypothetical protein
VAPVSLGTNPGQEGEELETESQLGLHGHENGETRDTDKTRPYGRPRQPSAVPPQPRGRAFEPDLPGTAREGQFPRTMVQNFPMTIWFVAW